MIRRPYRTKCRFFSDSDEENTIHWYVVPWSNGTLPYPHRILPSDWFPDRVNTKNIGEHSWEDRPFDGWGRIVPPVAPGDHICGTADDFSNGCLRNDPRPPLVRGPDGIPTCCRPILAGLVIGGGAFIGAAPSVLGGGNNYVGSVADPPGGGGFQPADGTPWIWIPDLGGFTLDNYIQVSGVSVGQTYRFRVWMSEAGDNLTFAGNAGGSLPPIWHHTIGPGVNYGEWTQTIPPGAVHTYMDFRRTVAPPPEPWVMTAIEPL